MSASLLRSVRAAGGALTGTDRPEEPTDEALAGRCRSGDESAWTELVRRYTRPLWFLALRSAGGRRDEAEDLVQEIFWKVSRNLDRVS